MKDLDKAPNEIEQQNEETEELDITEIIERIEKLEKENSENQKSIENAYLRLVEIEESIDAIAEHLKGE